MLLQCKPCFCDIGLSLLQVGINVMSHLWQFHVHYNQFIFTCHSEKQINSPPSYFETSAKSNKYLPRHHAYRYFLSLITFILHINCELRILRLDKFSNKSTVTWFKWNLHLFAYRHANSKWGRLQWRYKLNLLIFSIHRSMQPLIWKASMYTAYLFGELFLTQLVKSEKLLS